MIRNRIQFITAISAGLLGFASGNVLGVTVSNDPDTSTLNQTRVIQGALSFAGVYDVGGGNGLGLYANSSFGATTDPMVAGFQTLTTTLDGNTGSDRSMQVGDEFQINFSLDNAVNPDSGGYLGLSLRDSTDYSTFGQSTTDAELSLQLDDSGNWKIYRNGGTSGSVTGPSTSEVTFSIKVTSENTFNASIGGETFYDLEMKAGGGTIDSLAFYNSSPDDNPDVRFDDMSMENTGAVEFGGGNGSSTISGVISDGLDANSTSTSSANTLYKIGTGNITLSAANTHSGGTVVENGTLTLTDNDAAGSGTITVGHTTGSDDATLAIGSSGVDVSEAITVQTGSSGTKTLKADIGSGTATMSGAITLNDAVTVDANAGGQLDITGTINSGGNTLTKTGSGTVRLTGSRTANVGGNVNVNAGTLVMENSGAGNGIWTGNTMSFNVASGATLEISRSGGSGAHGRYSLTGDGTFKKSGSTFLSMTSGGSTVSMGSGALFHIEQGTYQWGGATPGSWAGNLSDLQIDSGAEVRGRGTMLQVEALTGSGNLLIGGNATDGAGIIIGTDNTAGGATFSGVIADASVGTQFSLVKRGNGNQVLSGNNTFSGGATVENGTLTLDHNNAAGTGTITLGAGSGSDAATLSSSLDGLTVGNALTVASGSSGDKTIDNATGSGSITFSGDVSLGDNVIIDAGSGETTLMTGDISGTGGITKNGAGTLRLTGGGGSGNSYSGQTVINAGTVEVVGDDSIGSSSSIFVGNGGDTGTDAALRISDSDGGTTFSRNITVNPGDGSAANRLLGSDNTSGVNTFSGNITLNGATAHATLQADDAGGTVGFSGNITGTSGAYVIKDGAGTVTLSGSGNNFTGGLFIDQGTVSLDHDNAAGSSTVFVGEIGSANTAAVNIESSGITVGNNITVRRGAGTRTIGSTQGTGDATFSGVVTLDEAVTLSAASGGRTIFSGNFADGVTEAGERGVAINASGGTVQFSGSTANGGVAQYTVQAGTLELNKTAGTVAIDDVITVNNGASLRNLAANQILDSVSVTVDGTYDLNNNNETVGSIAGTDASAVLSLGTSLFIAGGNDTSTSYAGDIQGSTGAGGLVKTGSGTLTLGGSVSLSSEIYIDEGTLQFNADPAVGFDDGSEKIFIGRDTNPETQNATLAVGGSGTVNIDRDIDVRVENAGSKTIAQNGTGTANLSGNIEMFDDLNLVSNSGGTLNLSGTIDMDAADTAGSGDDKVLNVSGANDVTISGSIEADTGVSAINKSGAGTLTLSGDSSSANQMKINISEGTVSISSKNNLGSDPTAGAYDDKIEFTGSGGTLQVTGNVDMESGTDDWGIELNAQGVLDVDSGATLTVPGVITGGSKLIKAGEGTLVLNSAKTFTGEFEINDGEVDVSATDPFAASSISMGAAASGDAVLHLDNSSSTIALDNTIVAKDTAATATLKVTGQHTTSAGITMGDNDLNDGGDLTLSVADASDSFTLLSGSTVDVKNETLTITGTGDVTFNSGAILTESSGAAGGNVEMNSSGTLNLNSGVNASGYAAILNVNAGTLVVDADVANGSVTVNNGGTLKGSGTVGTASGKLLTINNGGTLAPGNSIGTINAGDTVWMAGGSYMFEVNDFADAQVTFPGVGSGDDPATQNWDVLNVAGTLDLSDLVNGDFEIDLTSLQNATDPGLAANYSIHENYVLDIVKTTGGFDLGTINMADIADYFTVNTVNFQNQQFYTWTVQIVGNDLQLHHHRVIPEPNTSILLLLGAGLLARFHRLRLGVNKSV